MSPGAARTAGLLLAAGSGSRLGRPKALVPYTGELLVQRGLRLLAEGGCEPVLVVVGAAADEVRAAVPDAALVLNPDWATGMGSSLRAGLAALPDDVDAVVVALVDQPLVTADAVRRVRLATATPAAVATYDGVGRNPVRLHRSTWQGVAEAAVGDRGARAWLRAHPHLVTGVPCDTVGNPVDIDTPADLAALS